MNRALDAQTAQRSLVATLEITAAASTAHVLAGGHLPAVGFLLAFAVVVLLGTLATIGRFLRIGLVVPFVLAAQVGLHAALDTAPMAHHAMTAPTGAPLGLTAPMFWAHLVTALVTAIVLLLQERVLAAVTARFVVGGLVPVAVARQPAALLPAGRRPRRLLLRVSPRRGPPVRAALA